jgi:putative ABC transport system ATP-binding protein
MNDTTVRLEDVTKRYVVDADVHPALDHVSLEIARGEFVGIMGQSGSGKTTLLNLVGGLDRAYEGKVEVNGRDLATLGDSDLSALRNSSIGFVFQSYHLLSGRTCAENVAMPALFHREPVQDLDQRVDEVLRQVGLSDRKKDVPGNLSGGQKQRIAIARAMLLRPGLLLCDEPTGNLDQKTGEELMGTLRELAGKHEMTVVLVTHEVHVASACDRIVRLRDGRVVAGDGGDA